MNAPDNEFDAAMDAEQDLIETAIMTHAAKMKWLRTEPEHSETAMEAHMDAQLDLYTAAHDFIDACDAAGMYALISDDGHDVFRRIMTDPEKS